ncbi:MAG: hypothetical protein HY786_06230 [Deltaproteobacteria bacterium]|nr:hypothetical protein [Deltaproteobacteria bacterium]
MMITELKKAIKKLELQKDELQKIIQSNGWHEDRNDKRIPEKRESTLALDFDIERVEPEQKLLSPNASKSYQHWYSAGRAILEKNQSNRMKEFEELYLPTGKNTENGIKQLISKRYISKLEQFKLMDLINSQFDILAAVPSHLEFSIYDIELTAYSILMDDEISAAQHLLKKGFLRPSGALAGVILERHLKNSLRKHIPPIKYKEKDTLSPLNDLCKDTVYEVPIWRKIQHLTDLRNLCDHDKDREPTKDEVDELIQGVSKILKNQNL